jgi:hypothetical protein
MLGKCWVSGEIMDWCKDMLMLWVHPIVNNLCYRLLGQTTLLLSNIISEYSINKIQLPFETTNGDGMVEGCV